MYEWLTFPWRWFRTHWMYQPKVKLKAPALVVEPFNFERAQMEQRVTRLKERLQELEAALDE